MRKPNLFLIGAPKAGTTAFYNYLSSHPNIFLPLRDDTHFFAKDFSKEWDQVHTMEEYLALFRKAREEHRIVGERSVYYLYSKIAVQRIFEFNSDAKLLAMLRNPVDIAESFHSQILFSLNEDEEDFESAWRLQDVRLRGEHIPSTCRDPQVLQYRNIAMLGKQVQRALDVFPRKQVKFVIFDDLASSPLMVYKEALEFLGVPYDGRTEFPRVNVRREHRSRLLARLVLRQPAPVRWVTRGIKKLFGLAQTGVGVALMRLNSRAPQRKPMTEEFRQELVEFFSDDVKKLSRLIGRDLSGWLH